MTIFKQMVPSDNLTHSVMLPDGATPLHGNCQNGYLCIWFLCDPKKPGRERKFIFVGTGREIPGPSQYINTFLTEGLVFHLFEVF